MAGQPTGLKLAAGLDSECVDKTSIVPNDDVRVYIIQEGDVKENSNTMRTRHLLKKAHHVLVPAYPAQSVGDQRKRYFSDHVDEYKNCDGVSVRGFILKILESPLYVRNNLIAEWRSQPTKTPILPPPVGESGAKDFKSGETVMATWSTLGDGRKFAAEVMTKMPDGTFKVEFYDGLQCLVKPKNIRRLRKDEEAAHKQLLGGGVNTFGNAVAAAA